jgi:hypothetical protein
MTKRISLGFLLLVLAVAELFLCSAFAPAAWQAAIVRAFSHFSPKTLDSSVVTHPALDYEIDDMMRKNPGLRIALDGVIVLLIGGNAFLLTRVWKSLRASRQDLHGHQTST